MSIIDCPHITLKKYRTTHFLIKQTNTNVSCNTNNTNDTDNFVSEKMCSINIITYIPKEVIPIYQNIK